MHKKRYEGLDINNLDEEIKIDEIPGFREAGWTKKAYEQAKESEEKTFE